MEDNQDKLSLMFIFIFVLKQYKDIENERNKLRSDLKRIWRHRPLNIVFVLSRVITDKFIF